MIALIADAMLSPKVVKLTNKQIESGKTDATSSLKLNPVLNIHLNRRSKCGFNFRFFFVAYFKVISTETAMSHKKSVTQSNPSNLIEYVVVYPIYAKFGAKLTA